MFSAAVMATLVVVFRETLEAGLIVGIILTVLHRLGATRYTTRVWGAVALAVGASFLAAWLLSLLTESTREGWEVAIEGVISLVACAVLTHMVFWMDRQAKRIRPDIETKVEAAVTRQDLVAIALLPFLAVFREGAETALFLKAVAIQNSGVVSWAGGLIGGALAVSATAAIFVGGRKVPLRPLFRYTGFLLILMAAGMLAYGIHELEELGWIPQLMYPVWNINHILDDREGIGSFLKALFGYNGNPSLTEVIAYFGYLTVVLSLLSKSAQPPLPGQAVPRPGPATRSKTVAI